MNKDRHFIRVWQELDIKAVKANLLIAGSISGDCANCKEISIPIDSVKCPACGTGFKYIATRISEFSGEAKKLHAKRPDVTIIDFSDYKQARSRDKAKGIFG